MNEAVLGLEKESTLEIKRNFKVYEFFKRCFDIIFSLLLLIILSPLFLIIYILIKVESKGKVIYKHSRIGKNGQVIGIYKFRSMYIDSKEKLEELLKIPEIKKEWEENYKLHDDPRITKVGKILRTTSLDELPQLINILIGNMSFVGPRPLVSGEIDKYGKNKKKYLSITPGLTGWWACNGRSCTSYEERMKLELYYIDHRNITLDLLCICKTISSVFKRIGAK